MNCDKGINQAVNMLKVADSILFVTGAGISAESGLPTYRGVGGLYNGSTTEEGIPIEMALAGQMLKTRPEVTWKYLLEVEKKCREAKFNRAHSIVAEMEANFKRVWVLTQNIDGFHYAAGSRKVIDIHGDMSNLICTRKSCGWHKRVADYKGLELPPLCPRCRGLIRPEVVFFGEQLPVAKVNLLLRELEEGFDVCFSVGTTSVFPYIQQPVIEAKRQGRPVIEINPGETEVSRLADIKLPLGAVTALEAIWAGYQKEIG